MDIKKLSLSCLSAVMLLASQANAITYTDDCCYEDDCCFSGYVTYENVVVTPHFTRNNAYFLENPNSVDGQRAVEFCWDMCYTPRIEVGVDGYCGVGLRGRYWRFDHKSSINATSANSEIATWFADDSSNEIGFDDSDEAYFSHDMRLNVGDIELTFTDCGCCNTTFFVGFRFASVKHDYHAEDIDGGSAIVNSKQSFSGWGVTTGFDYLHPLACSFSVYAKARASLLYGDGDWFATNQDEDARISSSNCNDLIPVGELGFGLDWRRCFCDAYVGFVRIGVETQYWGSAGSAGPGCNAVYDEGNYQNSNPTDSSLGFVGLNIALGMEF